MSLTQHLRCPPLVAIALIALAAPAWSAELLMFRRVGCPYCQAWDQRVGAAYPRSDLGRELPLRIIDLDRDPMPAVALVRPVRYTPTFVVAEDGREIGRIEGFPGEDFFWGLIENLARKLPAKGRN
jgi:thiol-disulfide isomerase/thioredoxin